MKPFVTYCPSKHYVFILQQAFQHAGYTLEYSEIGLIKSELSKEIPYPVYHFVFYAPEDKNSKEVKKLIRKYYEKN